MGIVNVLVAGGVLVVKVVGYMFMDGGLGGNIYAVAKLGLSQGTVRQALSFFLLLMAM